MGIVPVHEQRHGNADGQEDSEQQRDALDRLAGLVDHRADDEAELRVTHSERKRRVFDGRQILRCHRGNDDPQCLRDDDLGECMPFRQPDRASGLPLPDRHGVDAAADDLSDEGGGLDHQA